MKIQHYRIAENFRGRKLSRIGEKYDFRGENFHGLLASAVPKDATPPNFAEKTFTNCHKTAKFAKVFSLESFPLYGIRYSYTAKSYVLNQNLNQSDPDLNPETQRNFLATGLIPNCKSYLYQFNKNSPKTCYSYRYV